MAPMSEITLRDRASLDKKYLWNAESVFADRATWRDELEAVKGVIPGLAARAGALEKDGAAALASFLDEMLGIYERCGHLYVYAMMAQAVDTGDVEAQGMNGRAAGVLGQFLAAVAFLDPELLAMGKEKLDSWLVSEPRLEIYRHYVENLFRKQAHVRSAEVEEVLGLVFEVFQTADNTRDMLVDADLKFRTASDGSEVAQGTIDKFLTHPDREVRRSAWQSYCDSHIAHENTLASALSTAMKRDVFNARARRFSSSIEAALFENDIPRAVFDSTIDAFKKNLPIWQRYWRVRRKALGVEKLEHCDIWAPIAKVQPVIPYEKAVDWIATALEPLGKDYSDTIRRGCLEERWVDVYPTVGKSSGAFSAGWKGMYPVIKMQYTDDLSSMSTLAHEMGHSMHSWHTWKYQPSIYSDYSIFVAEVASNFHQAMVRASLFDREKDSQFQIALIEEAMDNLHRYFFIMPTLARFELEMHDRIERGKGTTAEDMNALMADLFAEGYGGEMEVDRHREGCTWAQFGHL
jgi:oligoendopeptidase F